MSRGERQVEYIDTLSSGDSNNMISKQKTKEVHLKIKETHTTNEIHQTKEVNNNEVDELSKELSEMGCIVDAMKRPPNICVETCVYESDSEKSERSEKSQNREENEEDRYSDEFEEDKSEEQDDDVETVMTESKSDKSPRENHQSFVKLSKSQTSMSSNKPPSISGRSGRSTDYGSVSVPQTRRINMSFTNERLREIERHNHILLTKIMSARNTRKSSIPAREQPVPRKPVTSAAVTRKNQQRQIDHDNMILLKKIQRAKSSAFSIRR